MVTPLPGLADDERKHIEGYDVADVGYLEMRAKTDWLEEHSWRNPFAPPVRDWTPQMAQYAKDLARARTKYNAQGWPVDPAASGSNKHCVTGYGWMAARGD